MTKADETCAKICPISFGLGRNLFEFGVASSTQKSGMQNSAHVSLKLCTLLRAFVPRKIQAGQARELGGHGRLQAGVISHDHLP